MSSNDHRATREFFAAYVEPFLEKNGLSIKEFARGLGPRGGEDPKNVAKWQNGILIIDSKDRKMVMDYINHYGETPKKPEPVAPELLEALEEQKEQEKRENAAKTLPMWAIAILMRKYIAAEKIKQKDLADLIQEHSGSRMTQNDISHHLSGKTKEPTPEKMNAYRSYIAAEDLLGRFGMPEKPKPVVPVAALLPADDQRVLREAGIDFMGDAPEPLSWKATAHLAPEQPATPPAPRIPAPPLPPPPSIALSDEDLADVLSSISQNMTLSPERRRELVIFFIERHSKSAS